MHRRFIAAVVVISCVVFVGCKRDAEIESTIAELHSFSEELTKKVQAAPNPSAGVDEAQKLMDERKADLQSRMKSLKGIRGYQVSKETQQKMTATLSKDAMSVAGLQMKYISLSMRDPVFKGKLDKLIRDYTEIFKI